ncbi:MAG: zinc-binding dehydrogenase [Clostridia bacterium]|nr:zinc-binding dehydrogenase [Clostridia bacterium]
MKTLLSHGYYKGEIVDLPTPEITDDGVLVKICYCGICGTDQDLFSSECSFVEDGLVSYPARLGHEWSGIVEKVGKNVTEFKKGDRVVGDNGISCEQCEDCLSGHFEKCIHLRNVGTIKPAYDGAFAEYFMIPARHLHHIPDGMSLKEASLAEPFSVAYGGIKHMNINEKSVVAVIGTGCIGMAAIVLAKALGAKTVVMIGRNPEKLKVAQRLGAEIINNTICDVKAEIDKLTNGNGADYVLECSGAKETFKQAISIATFKGTVALIGFYEHKENEVNIDNIVSKALTLVGVMGAIGDMAGALRILKNNKLDFSPIVTDELPFDDCIKGFTRKNYPNSIKTTVKICEE